MGLIEWLTGWKYVGNTIKRTIKGTDGKYYTDPAKLINHIHPKILRKLEKKANKKMNGRSKRNKIKRGRKIIILANNIPSCVVYTRGKTFLYKGKESEWRFIDNQGHGGYVGSGMKIWRKLRKECNFIV